jgi:hypothetical protein
MPAAATDEGFTPPFMSAISASGIYDARPRLWGAVTALYGDEIACRTTTLVRAGSGGG